MKASGGSASPVETGLSVSNVTARGWDLPRYRERPSIYVIASQPRCGSHYLAYLLRQTGRAGVPLEYFHKDHWRRWVKRCGQKSPLAAFRVLCQLRTTQNGVFGVKAHWHQFSYALSRRLEPDLRSARYIYMIREDLLSQAISHVIALQTGSWFGDQKPRKSPRFSFDEIANSIRFLLSERSRWERFFSFTGVSPLRLSYESLVQETDEVMGSVCAFLGQDWIGDAGVPPQVQRSTLNSEWRARFLEMAAQRCGDDEFWFHEFGHRSPQEGDARLIEA